MSRPMRPSLTFTQAIKSVLCQNYINFNGQPVEVNIGF